jgi:DNA-directed RNA polymerase specialized sigma24 family protein
MAPTPGEPTRRTQRREQRRHWTGLDTPIGFERCARATLRELYGYVALLSGRDRAGAERLVADVYRSLFRAARAGHVDTVTLGALRSAARRAWLDEHRIELAMTDEVSRAPVTTIAELSTLERAVLVLRQVNGMSTDRAAAELGRPEREIAALDAHAVRRLRGTTDTTGAWLRAYLGPSVSPSPGLVDRIVRHLGDDEPADTVLDDTVLDDTVLDDDAADDTVLDAVPDDDAADDPSPVDAAATIELPAVERPTIELPVVATTVSEEQVHDPNTLDPTDHEVTGADPSEPDPSEHDPIEHDRRPRWALALGATLVAGLVVALGWLAVRGDAGDTVVSAPATTADPEAAPPSTEPEPDGGETASDATTPPDATPPPVVAPGVGFDPVCADSGGDVPVEVSWSGTLASLDTAPVLDVTLPASVDPDADPDRAAPRPIAILRPDGLVVALRPADGHRAEQTLVARVGLDGTVAWVRCFDGLVRLAAAPDLGVDLAVRPEAGEPDWVSVSVADGSPGGALDAVQVGVLENPPPADTDGDGPTLGFSHDSQLGRSVLAGLDDGRVVWTAPDVVLPPGDVFRAITVDDTVLAQTCAEVDGVVDCDAGELRGYDLASGELLWSRPGSHRLAASGDGVALVGDVASWELVDVRTGDGIDGRRWDDPSLFDVGDVDDVGFVQVDRGALVVARPGAVSVWLPRDAGGDAIQVAIP